MAPQACVFIVDLKSVLLCHLAITSAVIMAHFSRGSLSLPPVILFIVFLLPFCQSRNVAALEQYTGAVTMAEVNFTCPAGGKWYVPLQHDVHSLMSKSPSNVHRYACPSDSISKFVGCCQTDADPCSTGCAAGAIQSVNFNGSYHSKFPDASCADPSKFYTCGETPSGQNTFWGCCKINPCANTPFATCPSGSLTGAYIGLPEQVRFYVSSQGLSSAAPTPTSGTTAAPTSGSDGGSKSNGAVIGGAVGGAVGAILIIGLIFFFLWRRRRNAKTARGENVEVASPMMNDAKAFDPHSPNFAAQSRK